MNKKGQIFISDLIFAGIIFIVVLMLLLIYSNQVSVRINFLEGEREKYNAAVLAADLLVEGKGKPVNWENLASVEDIVSIGLAKTRNEIKQEKWNKLVDLNAGNYSEAKDRMGLAKHEVKIKLWDFNGLLLGEFGLEPDQNATVNSITRIVWYNERDAVIELKVYEE